MKEKINEILRRIKAFSTKAAVGVAPLAKSAAARVPELAKRLFSFAVKWWHFGLGALFAVVVLYYPAGAFFFNRIDVNPAFNNGSKASVKTADTLAALIGREVDKNAFTPNLPFFYPAAVLDNMPAYQTGIIEGTREIAAVLAKRNPDSTDLQKAAAALAYPATVWHVDDWKPAVSSNKKYLAAAADIAKYVAAVTNGDSVFDDDSASLKAFAAVLANRLKADSDVLAAQIAKGEKRVLDWSADTVFYTVKGHAYVWYLVARDLHSDFEKAFLQPNVCEHWEKAVAALKSAALMQPMVVVNGSPETQFAPNHLLGLGFYLSRAAFALNDLEYAVNAATDE